MNETKTKTVETFTFQRFLPVRVTGVEPEAVIGAERRAALRPCY